jgi:UDP-N-acetylglucosamine acyltransferase
MTSGHIAHNCAIGNNTVIASCSLVAGYVEVGDQAFISGGIAIHQFCRIGRLAMVAGMSRVNVDLPPFFTYMGYRIAPHGLNLVGLMRAGFSREQIASLRTAYRLLYRSGLSLEEALARIEAEADSAETQNLVSFVRASKRGICRERARGGGDDGDAE